MKFLYLLLPLALLAACSPQTPPVSEALSADAATPARIFTSGKHYQVLSKPLTEPAAQQGLTEYFWLGCPHCQNFEPLLKAYLAERPKVSLLRRHPALGERWAFDASVFYALQLGGNAALTDALFTLYRDTRVEKNQLPDVAAINVFLAQHQLDSGAFSELANSEQARALMEQANREMLDNRIQGVPAIVVKGKYLVGTELPDDIQSNEDYFQLLDYLLQKD